MSPNCPTTADIRRQWPAVGVVFLIGKAPFETMDLAHLGPDDLSCCFVCRQQPERADILQKDVGYGRAPDERIDGELFLLLRLDCVVKIVGLLDVGCCSCPLSCGSLDPSLVANLFNSVWIYNANACPIH